MAKEYISFKEIALPENPGLFGEVMPTEQKIVLRDEQKDAVKLAKAHFGKVNASGEFVPAEGFRQFLWNAKMRFGKTFCALQLAKEMNAKRVLIVTHRPVLDESWHKDFKKIFADCLDRYGFGTKFEREDEGNFYDLEGMVLDGKGYIFFASMQYLRRSVLVGGDNDEQLKKDILQTDWDLVVVDEAHEGTRTALGQKVINLLSKENTKMLHLSGTPFNLYGDFKDKEIYTWDYIQEQQAKAEWPKKHPGEKNPYEELPQMNIMTFSLGKLMDHFIEEGGSFKFTEFFRTWGGKDKDGKAVPKDKIGTFVHEEDVSSFLDLLCSDSETSHYPFSTDEYRDSFHHTLWIVPGVKEAAALENLLKSHPVFGEENGFKVINVAGKSPEDEEKENALDRVINAIGNTPEDTYTITISCGRLTTGVTVKPWTAVFYMKGSEMTAASTYMQTIFRVQSPAIINGKMKTNCYVFDFAPDRTLKMVAETAKFSSMAKEKAKKKKPDDDETQEERDRKTMKSFLELCPVISMDGGEMKPYEPRKLFEQLERVYIDRLVVSGFNDNSLYNVEELMNMDPAALNALGEKIALSSNMDKPKNANPFKGGAAGYDQLTPEQKAAIEEARRKKREAAKRGEKPHYTPEELAAMEAARKAREEAKKERENRISNIRGIALRIPLLMYGGADAGDPKEDLTVENFTRKIKDESWVEFMPRGITKKDFNDIRKCFNATRFEAAGKRYRALAKEADEMHVEDRIKRIADIFACFHNPDKETVLTPWRVVNMHLSNTLGGYCFFEETFDKERGRIDTPRYVDQGEITQKMFDSEDEHMEIPVKVLEINSKTGLYPLYLAYSFYRKRKDIYVRENLIEDPDNLSVDEEQVIWDDVVSSNVYVICNTPMATQITKRTLLGFRKISGALNIKNEKLVEKATEDQNELVELIKSKGYWNGTRSKEDMKFDAVVGNPPYQQKTTSAFQGVSIYNQFFDIARFLHPEYISMISPSRWMTKGSMGIKEEWVEMMLKSNHFIKIEDYIDFSEFFKNVGIGGGVNYFLFSAFYNGKCEYTLHQNKKTYSRLQYLDELGAGVVIRDGMGENIVKKIAAIEGKYFNSTNFSSLVGPLHFFDRDETLGTNWKGYSKIKDTDHPIKCYINKKLEVEGFGWIKMTDIAKSHKSIDIHKVYLPKAYGTAGDPNVIGLPFYGEPGSACSFSYIVIGYDPETHNFSKEQCENIISYMKTRFFRYLVTLRKKTQDNPSPVFQFVPIQDWSRSWIDEELYWKYGLEEDEIRYIEALVNSME